MMRSDTESFPAPRDFHMGRAAAPYGGRRAQRAGSTDARACEGACGRSDQVRYLQSRSRQSEVPRSARRKPLFAHRPRLRERVALIVLVAVVIVGVVGAAATLSRCGAALAGAIGPGAISGETSTPASEWRAGDTPFLYQTDPAWADEPYAGSTVGEAGCGPTCLTMAYVHATGRTDFDPASMCAFSERGGYVETGMTAWALMADGAKALGLSSDELSASESAVRDALASGAVVIASVGAGDFTTTGHFIVIAGVDGDGRFVVRDPNSAERSHVAWDADRVLSQCLNLWAISA